MASSLGLFERLHTLKNDAIKTIEESERLYYKYLNELTGDEVLGQVAIGLDSAISAVHKILLEYTVPR